MSTLAIKIKHAGKSYDVEVDTAASALAFKEQILQLTGVEVAKVKVVVKGGMLKVSSFGPAWETRSTSGRRKC